MYFAFQNRTPLSVPWREIATSKVVWTINAVYFTNNWGLYFLLTSLPLFLSTVLGYDITQVVTKPTEVRKAFDKDFTEVQLCSLQIWLFSKSVEWGRAYWRCHTVEATAVLPFHTFRRSSVKSSNSLGAKAYRCGFSIFVLIILIASAKKCFFERLQCFLTKLYCGVGEALLRCCFTAALPSFTAVLLTFVQHITNPWVLS